MGVYAERSATHLKATQFLVTTFIIKSDSVPALWAGAAALFSDGEEDCGAEVGELGLLINFHGSCLGAESFACSCCCRSYFRFCRVRLGC